MTRRLKFPWLTAALLAALPAMALEGPAPVAQGQDGLEYRPDDQGNRLPDFSHAGYGGGGVAIPPVPARARVVPGDGDDTRRIQAALDHLASQAPGSDGFRGAVVLDPGRYEVSGQLRIETSGIVLRGGGSGPDGTVLVATGDSRRALIVAEGKDDRVVDQMALAVADDHVPVGTPTLRLQSTRGLNAGDRVLVGRPSTEEWVEFTGMHIAPGRTTHRWKAGQLDLEWDRTVVGVKGNAVTLDAPLTTPLEKRFGGGTLRRSDWPGRITQVGIEHLRCVSAHDRERPRDEEHAWIAVSLNHLEDAWVNGVVAEQFVSSAVLVGEGSRRVTVQDCWSRKPVSELAGHRRLAFHTRGQLTLFQRCRSDDGRNDFSAGPLTTGPNVFLDCEARNSHGFSGSTGSWASGLLFDTVSVDGGELRLDNLGIWNQGVGWNTAFSMAWQCSASRLVCRTPPGAANWAVACWGEFVGDGQWSQLSAFTNPVSLYRAQLAERLGRKAVGNLAAQPVPPSHELQPLGPIQTSEEPPKDRSLALENGWLTVGGRLLAGNQLETSWWRGHLLPVRAASVGPAITRYVPGREGLGFSDDIDALSDAMVAVNQAAFRHHWGLWYDRRSDDHERTRRPDDEVWPPFFEQPWARSGQPQHGEAWDRLTRYDLTRYNPWYFGRLREFAGHAGDKGLVLVDEMFFQHNLLEAGAHWSSFPWRPANNLNDTGLPEPPPYLEGDGSQPKIPGRAKRIFLANEFYDITHPGRRELHRGYIRHCLANLADHPNVIHTTGEEFTGPASFVEFWVDTIAEWEREQGEEARNPLIALSTPKNVQEAILGDPGRARTVDVIEFKYWWRRGKGEFAPPGGKNLAPRQTMRGAGRPGDEDLARMAAEYRQRFPDKAVTAAFPSAGWAFAAAGGSLPNLPAGTDKALLSAIPRMQPLEVESGDAWAIGSTDAGCLVYAGAADPILLTLPAGRFTIAEIDPKRGTARDTGRKLDGGKPVRLTVPSAKSVLWLQPE